MKTAYLDAFSGLSGDMIVGAILDCGADFVELERAINRVAIKGYRLSIRRKVSSGISALKFDVEVTEAQPERHFGEIRAMIASSSLADTVKKPAIAIFELLKGFAVKLGDGAAEMVTPTGAAVIRALARSSEIPLNFEIEKIGYGAGSRDLEDRPNVLRMMLGSERANLDSDEMIEIAANIDDLNPQIYDHVMEKLFAAGARDVTLTPTIMKKGRPAITLSVIAEPAHRDALAEIIFAETTTIGLRSHQVTRLKLPRETSEIETRYGKVRVKLSGPHGAPTTITPEYEDCRRIATTLNLPLRG